MPAPTHGRYPDDRLPEGLPIVEAVNEYLDLGYQETDMQFNIGRVDGEYNGWGHDLVNPDDGSRVLVTGPSSTETEDAVEKIFGKFATFDRTHEDAGVNIYDVPEGTRPLVKTLRSAPYTEAYMRRLKQHTLGLIAGLGRLDPAALGLDLTRFALTFDDQSSLAHVTLVPPFRGVTASVLERYANENAHVYKDSDYIATLGLAKAVKDLTRLNKRGVLQKVPHAERSAEQFEAWLQNDDEIYHARPLSGLLRSIGVVTNDTAR